MIDLVTRTGRIHFDTSACADCLTFACIKLCSLYGDGILRLADRIPVILIPLEKASSRCIECLACELGCQIDGLDVLQIDLPMPASFSGEDD